MIVGVDAQILNVMMFRLLFGTQDDHYEPEYAHYITAAIGALDDASAAVTIKLAAMNVILELN